MLSIKNLSVSVAGKTLLHDLNFDFEPGKTYALMGPNGSGKSTLALALMGHPHYTIKRSAQISWNGKNLKNLSPDQRAALGIFLSFQSPLELSGITVFELLRLALTGRIAPVELHAKIKEYARELGIKDELLTRSLNQGFSGGEKKKLEALQAVLLTPRFALFDEIDSGVDIDALRRIIHFLKKHLSKDTTLLFITHSTKLLQTVDADRVIVLKEGRIIRTGKRALTATIEQKGFESL